MTNTADVGVPRPGLKGRVVLVTGASSGIGRALCVRLHGLGMKVVGCARRSERLDALTAELDGFLGVVADLRREDDILAVFEAARARFGGVDVLINNAGLGRAAPLSSGDTALWREMLEVNVLALCVCTREAITDMERRGVAGHIVHVSSMAAHRVPAGSGVYSATKFAVRSLTEGLRQELRAKGSDTRVTAVSPGYVETEFAEVFTQSKEAARETYDRFPVLTAEDVSEAVVYALSQPAHVSVHDVLMRPTRQPT